MKPSECGSVVGAREGESEGSLIRGTINISDGVIDGECESFAVGE